MNTDVKPYLTTLTPLRGIAALLVVVFHSNLSFARMFSPNEGKFISNGWLWVDFFFILSGFILSYVYSDSFKDSLNSSTYWKYVGARFARIYPLHFVTLIWSLMCALMIIHYADVLDPFFATIFNPEATPASLLLVQSLHLYRTAPLNTPSWSLSTEWWVYLIFPFLVPYFSRIKPGGKVMTFLFIIGFYIVIKFLLGPLAQPFPGAPNLNVVADFGLLRCLAGFMMGMLVFEIYKSGTGGDILKRSWSFAIIFLLTLILLGFSVENLIFVIALFPLIILTAAHNNTSVKRILDTSILQRLGDWSFSIYMVHVPIIQTFIIFFVMNDPNRYARFPPRTSIEFTTGLIYCIVVVILTLVVASVTYRFVEVPARNYFNRVFRGRLAKITNM